VCVLVYIRITYHPAVEPALPFGYERNASRFMRESPPKPSYYYIYRLIL